MRTEPTDDFGLAEELADRSAKGIGVAMGLERFSNVVVLGTLTWLERTAIRMNATAYASLPDPRAPSAPKAPRGTGGPEAAERQCPEVSNCWLEMQ